MKGLGGELRIEWGKGGARAWHQVATNDKEVLNLPNDVLIDPIDNTVDENSVIGVLAFFWFSYVMLRFHRCPHCRKSLPLFDFKSTNCRYCGSSLDEPESAWYVCPKCGKSNRRFDINKREIRYCSYCGCPRNKNTR